MVWDTAWISHSGIISQWPGSKVFPLWETADKTTLPESVYKSKSFYGNSRSILTTLNKVNGFSGTSVERLVSRACLKLRREEQLKRGAAGESASQNVTKGEDNYIFLLPSVWSCCFPNSNDECPVG